MSSRAAARKPMVLPKWMRWAMLATALMNIAGAVAFVPQITSLRALIGLPAAAVHPLYPATIGVFVLIFGIAYGWAGISGVADRLFVAVSAAGKLAFFALLTLYAATGALSPLAPLLGSGDLVFGTLFLIWLYSTRKRSPGAVSERD